MDVLARTSDRAEHQANQELNRPQMSECPYYCDTFKSSNSSQTYHLSIEHNQKGVANSNFKFVSSKLKSYIFQNTEAVLELG